MTDRASSGVRNLRAMFENQGAASSPEPRGRSPAGSVASDGTNRPTSKVRASFVSVEPSGHIVKDLGTTKGTPSNSISAHRRESFSVSEDLGQDIPGELKRVVSEEKEQRKKSEAIVETVPEQAVETRESSRAPPPIRNPPDEMPNLGSIMKGSDFPEPAVQGELPQTGVSAAKPEAAPEKKQKSAAPQLPDEPADNPDKIVSGVQEEAELKPADPKDEAAVAGGEALPPPTEVLQSHQETKPTLEASKTAGSKGKASAPLTPNGKTATKKPPTISTSKAPVTKASSAKSPLPKSPGAPRAPKTPTTPKPATTTSSTKSPALNKAPPKSTTSKEPAKAPAPKPSRTSLRPSIATAGTTASAAAKAKPSISEVKKPAPTKSTSSAPTPKTSTVTSPGGFKKPRPKSPTRPVRLPSHLIAPTASSAAKHEEESAQKVTRKPSTVTRPPTKAAPPARKQPSRASLAPSTAPTKRPESRASTSGAPNEGFLARMMRPTASSASKTHDKPTSPPRRGPSVKASAKPKEGTLAKGKQKVEAVGSKVKEAVTNGHSEEDHVEEVAHVEALPESIVEPQAEVAAESAIEPTAVPAEEPSPEPVAELAEEPAQEPLPQVSPSKPEQASLEEPAPEAQDEPVESSVAELHSPSFDGQTVR